MTKTLKQLLDQTAEKDRWGDIYSDNDEIVKTVREWLMQKRQEWLKRGEDDTLIIDELLEELK